MAAATITTEIQIVEARVVTGPQFGPRYAWQTDEYYNVYLNVQGRTIDGDTIYFNSPGIEMHVTSGGPVAVVTFSESNAWIEAPQGYVVESNKPSTGGSPSSKVQVGQVIAIRGRIKKEYSNGAKALNYVKRV